MTNASKITVAKEKVLWILCDGLCTVSSDCVLTEICIVFLTSYPTGTLVIQDAFRTTIPVDCSS